MVIAPDYYHSSSSHYNMSGALLHVPYAQSDAKIIFSGNEPDPQEKLIRIMEISTDNEAEERIAALEKRIRDMEALVKGLIAELLDLKTVAMAISRQDGERSRQELKKGTVVRGIISPALAGQSTTPSVAVPADDSTRIPPEGVTQVDARVTPAEPAMVRIMQADGTMKLEPRFGKKKMI
jgi:hypothetical protein